MKDFAKISVRYILCHDQIYFSPDFKLTIAGRRGQNTHQSQDEKIKSGFSWSGVGATYPEIFLKNFYHMINNFSPDFKLTITGHRGRQPHQSQEE